MTDGLQNRMVIKPVETGFGGALFDSALALRCRLNAERDPELDPDTEKLFRSAMAGSKTFEQQVLLATVDDVAVGISTVMLTHLSTNSDVADIAVEVDPDHRRRGIGRSLVKATVELAEANGRTMIDAFNVNSPSALAFWSKLGAERKLIERQSRLRLADTDEAMMHRWIEARTSRAGDYRLERFEGVTPPQFRAASAQLHTDMNDAPTDDLDRQPDVWSEEDVVALDELMLGRGRQRWSTIAFGPGDEPAGLTAISIQIEKPRFAHQGNTVVNAEHRNRGVGRWLKADMWLRLRREAPYVEVIDTDNAESNEPMLAINEAMGFEPLIEWGIWQAKTKALRVDK